MADTSTTPTWVLVLAPITSALAALGGALGSQFITRRSQAAQHAHELTLNDAKQGHETAEKLRDERRDAYLEFVTACDSCLSMAERVSAAERDGEYEPDRRDPRDGELGDLLKRFERVALLASGPTRIAAETFRGVIEAATWRDPSGEDARILAQARHAFMEAARADLLAPAAASRTNPPQKLERP